MIIIHHLVFHTYAVWIFLHVMAIFQNKTIYGIHYMYTTGTEGHSLDIHHIQHIHNLLMKSCNMKFHVQNVSNAAIKTFVFMSYFIMHDFTVSVYIHC